MPRNNPKRTLLHSPNDRARRFRWARGFLVIAIALVPFWAIGGDLGQSKSAQGLTVYLGIVPTEIIRGHPSAHTEATAHGGPPRGQHEYHIMVAVFDTTSGARIENAKIAARVSSLGLAGPRKALEPMPIADTVTYGNYFDLPGRGRYRIDVEIDRPQGRARFEFSYSH